MMPATPVPGARLPGARRLTATLCAAEILGMLGFSAVPALLPFLSSAWSLTATAAGTLTGAFFAGYMIAVPVLTALTDRIDARRIYRFATVLAALANLSLALFADGFALGVAFQVLAGIGLAGMYMPGLKLLSDHVTGPRQSRFVALYTSSFGVAASVSYVVAGLIAELAGWRGAFALAAGGAVAAFLLTFAIPRGFSLAPGARPATALLDMRPVLRSPAAMVFVAGYAVHNFELFALRGWMVAFLVFSGSLQPPGSSAGSAAFIAAIATLLGVATSIMGNEAAMRFGRRRLIVAVMALSALFAAALGWSAALPFPLVVALLLAYAMMMTLDSAALTAGALAAAPPGYRGATMAVHSSLGFATAFLGAIVVGAVLDWAGPGTVAGWGAAFAVVAAIDVCGAVLVWRLGRAAARAG